MILRLLGRRYIIKNWLLDQVTLEPAGNRDPGFTGVLVSVLVFQNREPDTPVPIPDFGQKSGNRTGLTPLENTNVI